VVEAEPAHGVTHCPLVLEREAPLDKVSAQ